MMKIKKYAFATICVFFAMAAFVAAAISAYGGGFIFDIAAVSTGIISASAFRAVLKIED